MNRNVSETSGREGYNISEKLKKYNILGHSMVLLTLCREVIQTQGEMMTKFDQALDYAIWEITNWKYRDRINKIYLYGSCARKEEQVDSVIDLYIELDLEIPAADIRDIKVKCNLGDWKLPDVEVKIDAGTNALADDDLFYKNIKKKGV